MDTLSKILNIILAQGLSDIEFTDRAGICRTSVAEWKSGKTKSYRKHMPAIAQALGVDVMELIGEENKKAPTDETAGDIKSILNKISKLSDADFQLLSDYIDFLISRENH